jgi:phosphotransferase system HPr-like phosphotransfer protein
MRETNQAKSLQQLSSDISFGEKVRIFSADLLKLCTYIAEFDPTEYIFTKKLYSQLIGSSQLLEDFLDFHGAKNSTNWFFYRELTAAVRHLSLGGYSQRHIANRLTFYDLVDVVEFERDGELTLDFLATCLIKLAPVIIEEARRLNIAIPTDSYTAGDFPGVTTSELLPHDITDENKDEQKEKIVKIANDFLRIGEKIDLLGFYKQVSLEEVRAMVPYKVNEVGTRRFELLVHNLQSSFDTYVIHGGFRYGNRKLKRLRGHFSVVFHLLQVTGRLLHFYERHLLEAGYKNIYKQVQERLADLVDQDNLLDLIINYGLYHVCRFVSSGKTLAQEILNENIERTSITVGIPVKLGFHSRPSLLVAKIVQHFGGEVTLLVGEDRFDASSVLDIQWAGGKINKEGIEEVAFIGDARALKDIEILASVNYGEDTMGKGVPLPKELKYLR